VSTSLRLDRARAADERLRALFARRRRDLAAIAHELARVKRERLYDMLGYTSVTAYAWSEHRMGKSKVCELIGISTKSERLPQTREAFDSGSLPWTKARESERLPQTREAFDSGSLPWTKAREVVKAATPETEGEWLAKASALSATALNAARGGRPPEQRRVLVLPEAAAAEYDQLLAAVRAELGVVPDWQAVLELMRRGASGAGGEALTKRLVISQCGECEAAHMESREGPVPVEPAVVEQARCSGEVHDLQAKENEVKRAIPTRVRRRVLDRDGRRCQVPTCRAMCALDLHHEGGWRAGHDPARIVTLCDRHHRLRHEGKLRIEGSAPDLRFTLVDGTPLAARPTRVAGGFSCENPGGASEPPASQRSQRSQRSPAAASGFSCENPGGASEPPASQRSQRSPAAASGFSCENSGRASEPPASQTSQRSLAAVAASGFSCENPAGGGDPPERPVVASVGAGVSRGVPADRSPPLDPARAGRDAELALRALGLSAREAERKVRRLLGHDERLWTAEELLRAALQAA
jgi:hypothetical protein